MFPTSTLAQSAPHNLVSPTSIEGEISSHPYVVGLVVSLLFAGLVVAVKLLLKSFEARMEIKFSEAATSLTRLEAYTKEKFSLVARVEETQDKHLEVIDGRLNQYDKHVAVGAREIVATNESIARVIELLDQHKEKEETITWGKIDKIGEDLGDLKIKVASIEAKMPNGELAKLADAYHQLALRTDQSRDLEEYARLAELDRNRITKARKHQLSSPIKAKKPSTKKLPLVKR